LRRYVASRASAEVAALVALGLFVALAFFAAGCFFVADFLLGLADFFVGAFFVAAAFFSAVAFAAAFFFRVVTAGLFVERVVAMVSRVPEGATTHAAALAHPSDAVARSVSTTGAEGTAWASPPTAEHDTTSGIAPSTVAPENKEKSRWFGS
jgi:hypothetical protein